MNEKIFGMLGLARRAGKLSLGHDAAFESIKAGKASLCLLCSDASDRLKNEFDRTVKFDGRNVPLIEMPVTLQNLNEKTGIRAAVMTVNDEGFAKKILMLYGGNV